MFRRSEFRESTMQVQQVRPCSIMVPEIPEQRSSSCCNGHYFPRFVIAKPVCCWLSSYKLLAILSTIFLISSIVSLILTCIFAPNILFIILFILLIITNFLVLVALGTDNHALTKISFTLLVIIIVLEAAGVVHSIIYGVSNFHVQLDSSWKVSIILFIVVQIVELFYLFGMAFLLSNIMVYQKQAVAEKEAQEKHIRNAAGPSHRI